MLTADAARRVGRAVSAYERGSRDIHAPPMRTAGAEEADPAVRLGTISATWAKGATATVTEQNGDGSAKSPASTFTAKNYFAAVTVTSGTKRVACAKVDDTWMLIAAEC
jgi:hypothetical protein